MAQVGVASAIFIHLAVITMLSISIRYYLAVKDNLGFDSYSELAYLCFGRASIFMINAVVLIVMCGVITLYYLLFVNIGESLIGNSLD